MTNLTLERIVSIDAKKRSLAIPEEEKSILLCLALLEEAFRNDVFKKMHTQYGVMNKHFMKLVDRGDIETCRKKKADNNKEYDVYRLSQSGERITGKILGLIS